MILQSMPYPATGSSGPPFSAVVLLMGFEGSNGSTSFADESSYAHVMAANGGAQISTGWSAFGSGSGAFDGSGDYISTADSGDWDFGSGPFTVELFARFAVKQNNQALIGQWGNTGPGAWFFWITGGNLMFRFYEAPTDPNLADLTHPFVPTLGQKYHLAFDRDAAGWTRLYIDGVMVQKSSGPMAGTIANDTHPLTIGRVGTGTSFASSDFNGNMDEIRITKGYAVYGSDAGFPVPTAAYPRS